MDRQLNRLARRYLAATGLVMAAHGLALALNHFAAVGPVPLFLLAVLASARVGGLGPGLLATGLSTLLIDYFFLVPLHSLKLASVNAALDLLTFAVVALAISSLHRRARAANRSAARARIEAERHRVDLQAVIDAAPDGVIVFDVDGRVRQANRAFRDWCVLYSGSVPRSARELARLVDWAQPGRSSVALLPIESALRGLRASDSLTIRVGPGAGRRVHWRAAPVVDQAGTIRGAVVTWQDRTDLPDDRTPSRDEQLWAAISHAIAHVSWN
jgi:PAS domain-containing protein